MISLQIVRSTLCTEYNGGHKNTLEKTSVAMGHIMDHLRQRMTQKKMDKQIVGTLVLQELNKLYPDYDIEGYVKHDKLFVRTYDQGLKIDIQTKKQQLLDHLSIHLKHMGYGLRIIDIRFK